MYIVIQGYHITETGECGFRYSPIFDNHGDAYNFKSNPPEEYFLSEEDFEYGDVQDLLICEIPLTDIGEYNHNWVIIEPYL